MRIELNHLTLTNFKGVQKFDLDLFGQDAIVSGANGTGKTTIFDAWLWLLFDMDSRGNKGAEAVKTTSGAGFVHYLTHEVAAAITVDGKARTLRKALTENWVKPRGKAEQEFKGNVSNYWIDDIPMQLKDYQAFINDLIPADLFKIISDPMYFSTGLGWKDRLNMLVEISGGISDEEVVTGDKDLEALLAKMDGKCLTDYRKMVQEQIRRLNSEIDSIPARIDEQRRSIPAAQDYVKVEADLESAKARLAELEASETSAKDALKPLLEVQDQIFRLRRERDASIDRIVKEMNADRSGMSQKQMELVSEKRRMQLERDSLEDEINIRYGKIEALDKQNAEMRIRFTEIRQQIQAVSNDEFDGTGAADTCPTCGQKLPDDVISLGVEKLRTQYEAERTRKLESLQADLSKINATGKDNASRIAEFRDKNARAKDAADELAAKIDTLSSDIQKLSDAVVSQPVYLPQTAENEPEIKEIDQKILELDMKLAATPEDRSAEIRQKKAEIRQEIERLNGILYARETAHKAEIRVSELETDLRTSAAKKTLLEGDIWQCDRFVRARTEKLEGKINGMFTKVGFKLFTEQVNGGLTETCEAIVNNTTFSKANTAGQINAGMDIIRTISRFKGVYVPVFVDHLESINSLLPLPSQVISLLVSEEPELKVNVSEKQEVA